VIEPRILAKRKTKDFEIAKASCLRPAHAASQIRALSDQMNLAVAYWLVAHQPVWRFLPAAANRIYGV
jgi:hypothetical protein